LVADEERTPHSRTLPSVIGITVVMKGDLTIDEDLVIEGTYAGTINARDTVTLRRTAHLSGEVSANRVQVEDGTNLENAVLSGRICLTED
jgi:cytoskeletal protein CcmA (bactofilin family)